MRFDISYSPVTFILLIGLHLLAVVSVYLAALPELCQVFGVGLLMVSAATVRRDYGCHSPQRIQYCSINSQGSILSGDFGREMYGSPRLVYRSESLVVLEFLKQGSEPRALGRSKRKLILSADALEEADFCSLQRYLRFEI